MRRCAATSAAVIRFTYCACTHATVPSGGAIFSQSPSRPFTFSTAPFFSLLTNSPFRSGRTRTRTLSPLTTPRPPVTSTNFAKIQTSAVDGATMRTHFPSFETAMTGMNSPFVSLPIARYAFASPERT